MPAPVFLLAFAYDPTKALPKVVEELKLLQRLLARTGVNTVPFWQVTAEDLTEAFDTQRNSLQLFHFSGHASLNGIQLNNDGGSASRIVLSKGLALKAGRAKALRLVFLNGCSTYEQAQVFLDQGVPAVIATTKPLLDRYGADFARRFYQSFTRRNGLNTLKEAFEEAFIDFCDANGQLSPDMFEEQARDALDLHEPSDKVLYELHLHPEKKQVGDERFTDWVGQVPEPVEPRKGSPGPDVPPSPGPDVPPPPPGPDVPPLVKIQDLLRKGNLEEALAELERIDSDASVLLQSRYYAAKRENIMGLLKEDAWRRINAQIANGIVETVKNL